MLDRLSPRHNSRSAKHRIGRGVGSGWGKTSGRGQKGAGARAGSKDRSWFEGGQMALQRRLPKWGFTNLFRKERQVVNVGALAGFEKGSVIDAALLAGAGIIPSPDLPLKVLAEGELTIPLTIRAHAASAAARAKIEAAGGTIEIVASPAKERRN
jgi:large subunit ribosomal protein L15